MNPRLAFFGVPAGRPRDVMQALCFVSDKLERSSFDITSTEIARICGVPLKTVHRSLEVLSGLGYLTFSAVVAYRTTYSVTLIEQRLKQSAQDTMSHVQAMIRDMQMRHGVPSSNAPPGINMGHLVPSEQPNTGHGVPSSPPKSNTAHHEPSFPNSTHHEPTFPAGEPRGGRGGEEREGSLMNQHKSFAFREIQSTPIISSSSGFKLDAEVLLGLYDHFSKAPLSQHQDEQAPND